LGIYTKKGLKIADGYIRIIYGDRGDYIEVNSRQIILGNLHIPEDKKWKESNYKVYYIEYRSNDKCNVKVYYQKKEVSYADYKIGYYYISLNDVNIISETIKMS